MIVVNLPLLQKEMRREIESYKIDGKEAFKFVKKENVKLFFETTIDDDINACNIVKNIIKNHKYGSALMYHVVPCDGNNIKWFV